MPTIAFLVTSAVLAVLSVGVYVRSLASGAEEQPAAPSRSSSRNDDELGLSSPTGAARPKTLMRRHTVTTLHLGKKYWTIEDSNETMSSFMFVVNMFADLCPPGFLPLAFGLKETGYIPGFVMLLLFYALCVYTMWAISKSMEITGAKDFANQWMRAISEESSWVPVLVVVLVCLGCTLSYSCFFADIFASVMPAFGIGMSRSLCLLSFTVFPTMPLCLLKNLSALSYSSSFALVAVIYTAGVMVARAADGSYAAGGRFFQDLEPQLAPSVPSEHLYGFGLPSLVLLNTLAMAFLSHYNGCKYYRELASHTPTKLVKCTATAMGICVILFGVTMVAGFQTFGVHADGVILKNYSEKDVPVNMARLGIGLSIVASYPLMFSGLREAVITLLKLAFPLRASEFDLVTKQDILSMILLALITGVALVVTDAGLVVGVVGALCGSTIIYIVPCTLYASAIKGYLTVDKAFGELMLLRGLTVLGTLVGVAGCYTSLAY